MDSLDLHFAVQTSGSKLRLAVNGADYSYINTPTTGGWSSFTGNADLTIPLAPGPTNIILFTGGNGGVNPDYVAFTPLPPGPWNAQAQNDASFGIQTNQFGFDVVGDDWTFVVKACTNLANPIWSPVATNTVIGTISGFNMAAEGVSYFSDPQWTNYPGRYYRLTTP
jgi:hypothetical protein